MKILGKVISEPTANLIDSITSAFCKPVLFSFTSSDDPSYGHCNPFEPDAYRIFCKESLLNITKADQPNIPFETNILHELFHICQMEEGFPSTFTYAGRDDGLGSLIVSSILDIDVDHRLLQFGFDSSYFHSARMKHARKVALKNQVYTDPLEFVQMAVSLSSMMCRCPEPEISSIVMLYGRKNAALINCIFTIAKDLKEIGCSSPESAFRSLVYLFDAFSIWNNQMIVFQGKQYRSLSEVQQDFSRIRIARR